MGYVFEILFFVTWSHHELGSHINILNKQIKILPYAINYDLQSSEAKIKQPRLLLSQYVNIYTHMCISSYKKYDFERR